MKRLFAITALLTGLWCGTVSAQWVSGDVSPQSIGPISVYLADEAIDACWTNLREVREYAEEKLRMSGYSTREYEGLSAYYSLHVSVVAYRNNGTCFGDVSAEVRKFVVVDGVRGDHVVGAHYSIANRRSNLNNIVIATVQELIDEM